ncbi:hypothetical protein ACJ72_08855, partial [Emergomyces africanus]
AEQEEQVKINENYVPRELQRLSLISNELKKLKWCQKNEK